MRVGPVDTSRRVLIIAEIGNNHEGALARAEAMVEAAARAGADAVKFQTIVPDRLVAPDQVERLRQLERFRLTPDQFARLAEHAGNTGVTFLSTPFDLDSVDWLNPLVPAFKIASGDNDFYPLLERVATTGKPVLLSSGMADLDQVLASRDFLWQVWKKAGLTGELAVLHCVSSYPTPPEEANLRAITELSGIGIVPGYSDHTVGVAAAPLAVALGARIIEKHFTLDKQLSSFRDHRLSADPVEFAELVRRVRETEAMLGSGGKQVQPSEAASTRSARRSIVARRDLPAGHRIRWDDLDWLRPRVGLPPGREAELVDGILARPHRRGEPILPADLRSAREAAS